ncbi:MULTISPECIES: hypothetical protein [Marinobacter]|uniref:Prophage protein n=1 Tax=Marinobacter xestospongiae TaxID=994319 RepID=A0ABU3W0H9_9GAMM|nr:MULTISPECIES: hypothetical protein [Marinobacter]MCG8516456.1 hypothetical protein [Pseudomonadales bacterium]MCK7569103.1 hypothetical protein [Marinobacter xestospongiae]MDV2079921.1 hypothetical protein [Marinobacter xestospongiae]UDL03840.1 hypothetical protein J2887_14070 [Marinobacter sp. CA1]
MEKFTLDGKTYSLSDLPEEAQRLARQAAMTSELIQKLEARTAIAKTAQARYLDSLKATIENQPGNKK